MLNYLQNHKYLTKIINKRYSCWGEVKMKKLMLGKGMLFESIVK